MGSLRSYGGFCNDLGSHVESVPGLRPKGAELYLLSNSSPRRFQKAITEEQSLGHM